jgi:hypothetical protein
VKGAPPFQTRTAHASHSKHLATNSVFAFLKIDSSFLIRATRQLKRMGRLEVLWRELYGVISRDDVSELKKLMTQYSIDSISLSRRFQSYLYMATNLRKISCLKYLLSIGANPNPMNGIFDTILTPAFMSDESNRIQYVFDNRPIEVDLDSDTAIIKLLIEYGAKLSLVPANIPVPEWVILFVEQREACRRAAIIYIGMHKFKRTPVPNSRDTTKLIGKQIWLMRPR